MSPENKSQLNKDYIEAIDLQEKLLIAISRILENNNASRFTGILAIGMAMGTCITHQAKNKDEINSFKEIFKLGMYSSIIYD